MLVLQKKGPDAHVIQGGLADRVILDTQHLHHLLHLTEHLSQRDILRLQLVLDLSVVSLLWGERAKTSYCKLSRYTLPGHVFTLFHAL